MRVLAINGAYRKGGATDQLVDAACSALNRRGVETDVLVLRDVEIGFCRNCRVCMQKPGETRGECVIRDAMDDILRRIESSDAFILASSTNAGSATAVFRRLVERLVVFGYWPWGQAAPKFRKAHAPKKKAVLIATCGAPGLLGRFAFSTQAQLAATAKLIGAKVCGSLFSGLHAQSPVVRLSRAQVRRAERVAERLL